MDELDKLLTDLHSVKGSTKAQPPPKAPRDTVRATVNFSELDDLMAQFAEVLNDSRPVSKMVAPAAKPVPAPRPKTNVHAAAVSEKAPKHFIPFEELSIGTLIGKGNFGAVHEGRYNGAKVAIKELFDTGDANVEKYYEREIEMLSLSRHPNIVQFLGVSKGKNKKLYMVTEFCEGEGDLHEVLKKRDMGWKERAQVALGIAKAVAYLHGKGIIHRDLKCENVLLEADGTPKVCDFGFARPIENDSKKQMTMCGTDWTMAPEILLCMDYTEKVDVFSYGMILCELLSRISPNATNFKRVIPGFGIDPSEVRTKSNPGAPKRLIDLCISCTDDTPSNRPNFSEIIKAVSGILGDLIDLESADERDLNWRDVVQELEAIKTDTSAKKVELPKDEEGTVTKDVDGVVVRRRQVHNGESDTFVYAVENTRPSDVLLTITISGDNSKIVPVGQATGLHYKVVEGVVPAGSQMVFATVEPSDPSASFAFSESMAVERIDTEIRVSELQGVYLTTQIQHGKTTEISFEVFNKRKDYDVEVEIEITGGPLLEGSSSLPLKAPVRKGEKRVIGKVRAEQSLSTSWRYNYVQTYPDEKSTVNGVHLIRRHLGGRRFEFEVENTRDVPISVEMNFSGPGSSDIYPNPATATISSHDTGVVTTIELSGQMGMDWKWSEKK